MAPRAHYPFAFQDALEAAADDGLGRKLAAFD